MNKAAFVLLFFCFAIPALANAAGFVHEPLFLSKSPVTAGQKVRVYAIVSNDAATPFSGTVVITADKVKLGAPEISLAVGATQTVSVSWLPNAGTHTVVADLTNSTGSTTQEVSQEFTVLAPPAPAATSTPALPPDPGYQSSLPITKEVQAISPAAAPYLAPVLADIDSARVAIVRGLDSQTAVARAHTAARTASTTPQGSARPSAKTSIGVAAYVVGGLWLLYGYLLAFARFIINSAAIFYPCLLAIIFYVIWRVGKRFA